MKILILAGFALALSACAGSGAVNDPVFREGYDAGCTMAHSAREARAAMTQGKPDLYRRGFASGLSACGAGREPGA